MSQVSGAIPNHHNSNFELVIHIQDVFDNKLVRIPETMSMPPLARIATLSK